jgi:N-methylhydantoinase A
MANSGNTTNNGNYIIYVDTGGTFSDCIILKPDGTFVSGKAPTTPENLSQSFFDAIKVASSEMGQSLDDILRNTIVLGYGTTEGTNIVVTGKGSSQLGLITDRGHEDRTLIMRLRAAGLQRRDAMRLPRADKPEPLIPRKNIRGITERIDCQGKLYIPLRENEVRRAVNELLEEGVEGIAVALLWSFLNPSHERRIAEIIDEIAPGLPVSLSSTVAPLVREYPRTMTTIIDLYIGKELKKLLGRIRSQLAEHGYRYPLLIMQAAGGLARSEIVNPVTTLHSGPVGGFIGVEFIKTLYGFENSVGADMGGTSFDICVSPKGRSEYLREPIVGRWEISNPMRDITTIGAGGGTLARVEKIANLLIVGPESAGAAPGPVCFDRGGEIPTITDADVVMNRIDSEYFLKGRYKLNKAKAAKAIMEKIAEPLKMDVMTAAEGICKVLDAKMGSTIRAALAIKGGDISQYALVVYGGAGPTHCAGFTAGMNFKEIIIPPFAAVFSAFGAATANITHRYEASPFLTIKDIPYDPTSLQFTFDEVRSLDDLRSEGMDRFNRIFGELEERARDDMRAEGLSQERYSFNYEIFGRYGGQLWEVRASIPINRINSVSDLKLVIKSFEDRYYDEYGLQAMGPRGGVQIITITVEVQGRIEKPMFTEREYMGANAEGALKGEREVYFDGGFRQSRIYAMDSLLPGNVVHGPSIIEGIDTTVVIPEDRQIFVDKYRNMLMRYK